MLGHDAGIRENGHEVDVTVPAGNDVDVEVILQSRARTLTDVDSDVCAVWRERALEGFE